MDGGWGGGGEGRDGGTESSMERGRDGWRGKNEGSKTSSMRGMPEDIMGARGVLQSHNGSRVQQNH